jgi:hypothetical protein
VGKVERPFTSNWYIHRVCLSPLQTKLKTKLKVQNDVGKKISRSGRSPSLNRSFGELLLEAVDEVLSSLGDSPRQAIYYYLKEVFNLSKQDIPHRIDDFSRAIEEIFGSGARFLEIEIMKRLYEKVGHSFKYSPEQNDLFFIDYVKAVMTSNPPKRMRYS